MLLPAGDFHDFRDRRALGPAEQGDDRSLLGIRFRTAARLLRSLGFFPRLARLAGSTSGRRQDDQLCIGEFHGMLRWVGGGGTSAATTKAPRRPNGAGGERRRSCERSGIQGVTRSGCSLRTVAISSVSWSMR